MSKLRSNIEEKYKIALKEKNEIGIRTYRLIKSAIKEKDISLRSEKNKEGLTDEGILSLFQNLIKQRNESIDMYKKANRDKLVQGELEEIKIIRMFLPKQLEENEVRKIIESYIRDNNLSSNKEIGLIMNYLKINYAGVIEMSLAGKLTKEIIKK